MRKITLFSGLQIVGDPIEANYPKSIHDEAFFCIKQFVPHEIIIKRMGENVRSKEVVRGNYKIATIFTWTVKEDVKA